MSSSTEFKEVDASELNMPTRNRIGDIQIDRSEKYIIDPQSIVCKADDDTVDCAMNTLTVNVLQKNKPPKSPNLTYEIDEDRVEQRRPAHRTVSLMFSHYTMKSIEFFSRIIS